VLGFDLVRLEGGPAAAEVLLGALTLTPADLPVLAGCVPGDHVRLPLWQEVSEADRRQRSIRGLAGLDPEIALNLLESAPIGTLDGLLHCLRHDVLDWTRYGGADAEPAAALLSDALVASYLRSELPVLTRRALALGWVTAVRRLPARPTDLGPQHRVVAGCLDRVGAAVPSQLDRLAAAGNARAGYSEAGGPGRRDWAAAMHSATWAVYLAGRVRAAAAAQLRLVLAIRSAGAKLTQLAAGGWNAASGAVQALLVRDMLDADLVSQLVEPYRIAFGPAALG
jgi:hypothetical protein